MSPLDGTLWIIGRSTKNIYHYTTAGVPLGLAFASGVSVSGAATGIGIAPDGLSLYATGFEGTVIRHLDLTGVSLGDIPIDIPANPFFLTVVPAPEPGSAVLLLAGRRCSACAGGGWLCRATAEVAEGNSGGWRMGEPPVAGVAEGLGQGGAKAGGAPARQWAEARREGAEARREGAG